MLSLAELWEIHSERDLADNHDAQLSGYLMHATFWRKKHALFYTDKRTGNNYVISRADQLVRQANWLIFMESNH